MSVNTIAAQAAAASIPSRAELDALKQLCDDGLYQLAYEGLQGFSEWRSWRSVDSCLLAARIVGHVGAQRLASALQIKTFRRHPLHADALIAFAQSSGHYRNPHRMWCFFNQHTLPENATGSQQAEWLCAKALVHARLHDRETAHSLLADAEQLAPDNAWLQTYRAFVLNTMDETDAALAIVDNIRKTDPLDAAAIQQYASLKAQANDMDAAISALLDINRVKPSGRIFLQLADLYFNQGQFHSARDALNQAEQHFTIADKELKAHLWSKRLHVSFRLQDTENALTLLDNAPHPVSDELREHIKQLSSRHQRIVLNVPFVRQNHMTCAPATLSAICQYWGKTHAHLDIAEKICYDGTPHYSERSWAENNGFKTVEFTATWENARQLVDAGFPFTITTVHTQGSHLQAVVGYDEWSETLLLRDPNYYALVEYEAKSYFVAQEPNGPRGLVLNNCSEILSS